MWQLVRILTKGKNMVGTHKDIFQSIIANNSKPTIYASANSMCKGLNYLRASGQILNSIKFKIIDHGDFCTIERFVHKPLSENTHIV